MASLVSQLLNQPASNRIVRRVPLLLTVLIGLAWCAPIAADTLVVCPSEFRAALEPWESHRRGQGHRITVIRPAATAAGMRNEIRRAAKAQHLKYLLIIGDVPSLRSQSDLTSRTTVPTNYLPAKVNTRWGSEATIATDGPYGDTSGDGVPDLAVGRIPADSAEELAAVVNKILRYERQAAQGDWQKRLEVVGGVGGFGIVADSLIEGAARQVFQQTVPADYEICRMMANPDSPYCPPPGKFGAEVRERIDAGCFAWIYLGHGSPTELARVRRAQGDESIMTVGDAALLRCGPCSPLAVMIACYTGAVDGKTDCLAERLLLEEDGPVAVVAATRVSMPYGNTVLGCELLRSCFRDRTSALGDMFRTAQQRTLAPAEPHDELRSSVDTMALAVSPAPTDLSAERQEHVAMYMLFGDPLIELQMPPKLAREGGNLLVK